jgi:hypothetical protein
MDKGARVRLLHLLLGVLVTAVLATCSGSPAPSFATPAPVPTVRPSPTPTPTPPPTPEDELAAACDGTPVPWAAPYTGKVHPLVVVDTDALYRIEKVTKREAQPGEIVSKYYPINKKWINGQWTGPMIQLVICDPGDESTVRAGSCGKYTRQSDGRVGKLIRRYWTKKVRVVVAATARTLQTKTVSGTVPKCPGTYSSAFGDLSGKPPWFIEGPEVTDEQISKFASTVSKQPVR